MIQAFMFPGQGAQEVGMAADLFDASPHFRDLMALGAELTHEDLLTLCLRGPERKLRRAFLLQPVMVAVSLGYLRRLLAEDLVPVACLGHSLGEITALAAAGVVSDREAVTIAAKRGELMDSAASRCDGGMLAVLSVALAQVEELLAEFDEGDRITMANDNADGQVVVSGDSEALRSFASLVSSRKLGRCKPLAVAGPWHSPFMASAQSEFEAWIEKNTFSPPSIPLILNSTGTVENDPQSIKKLISRQLTSPVRWRQSMQTLRGLGVDTLFEIGPGRILSGLARANGLSGYVRVFNINNLRGLAHYREEAGQAKIE